MKLPTSGESVLLSSIALCVIYAVALVPGSFLAYVGMRWMDGSGRGWRTQLAATVLLMAWFPLALGLTFTWQAARTRSGLNLLVGAVFGVIALICYAVAIAWGGGMLI